MITAKSHAREVWDYLRSQGYLLDSVTVPRRPVQGYIRIGLQGQHQAPAAAHIAGLFAGSCLRDATSRNDSTLVLIPVH